MANPNFYPPFQYTPPPWTPPHVFHPPQSPNDFRQEVEGKLTQIMQSIEKMQQLLTGPPIPVMANTDEESAHSKETSSNLVNQSSNMPTPVSLIDNLDNLSRDVKLTDVDSEDLKQLKVPDTAVDDPHMFDKSPEKIYVVQISPTPLDAPISVVSLVGSTKRALSIGSDSELTLNDDKMVYKFHENEYGKVHEKLYRNFNNLANALQVLEKLPIKDKIVENNESDVDGEKPHTGIITFISNDKPAFVSCVDDERLEFQAGDCIKSLALHFEMCKKSIKTICFIVSSILQCLCRMGFSYKTVDQFMNFNKMGICLDGVVHNIAIDALGKLGKLQEDERDIEEQRATLSTAHSSPIDVADIKSGGVLQNDAINRNSGHIIAYAKTIIYAWQLNVKCAHLELVYLVKIQAPEQAALEGNYGVQILNQKLGLVVVDSCFFNMLWNTRKAEMKGIDVYIFLNGGSNSLDVTENNIYLDTEVDDLYWTLDYVKIQVLKVEVNQIIKVCNSQDKKWRLKILFIIAPKKLLTTFFHPTSSDKEFYLCALVGLIGATRLTLYHDLLDEGYFPTYEYQDVVHLLSYVYLICFSVMLVVALIIYAYWTTTLMGIFMKFDDLLETSSNHVGLTMFKFASVPQLLCCKR